MNRILLATIILPALTAAAHAADLSVTGAFARATPGNGPGGAYLTIHGGETPDRLLSATSPKAAKVELHTMTMQGNVMRMREVDAIDVPAHEAVTLAPNKPFHLMLQGLKAPLKQGQTLPITLHFEHAGDRTVTASVEGVGATTPGAMGGMKMDSKDTPANAKH